MNVSDRNSGFSGRQRNGGSCAKKCCGGLFCVVVLLAVGVGCAFAFGVPKKLGQHIISNAQVSMSNCTMSPCASNDAWLQAQAQITLDIPLGFLPIKGTVSEGFHLISTTTCGEGDDMMGGYSCDNPNVSSLGNYSAHEMTMGNGVNNETFNVRMQLTDNIVVMSGFIFPMFMYNAKSVLIIEQNDIKMTAMGVTMTGLTLKVHLTCQAAEDPLDAQDVPNWVCHPGDEKHEKDSAQGFDMKCEFGHADLKPTTTTTIETTTTKKIVLASNFIM